MQVQKMIDRLSWYEKKNENDKSTSLGYGARFDPLFKGVKVHDNGNTVYCVFNVPWWMTDDPLPNLSHAVKTVLIKKYHTQAAPAESTQAKSVYDGGCSAI